MPGGHESGAVHDMIVKAHGFPAHPTAEYAQ